MSAFEFGGRVVDPLHAVAALEEDTFHDVVAEIEFGVFAAQEE